jgi:hypothetical protein
MKFHLFRTSVIRNLAVATDDPRRLPGSADLNWQALMEFDEADPVRKAWFRDDCVDRAKELIAQNGFVQLAPGAGIDEPG